MMRTPDDKLRGADVARLAERYGISVEAAGFYLRHWLGRG